MRATTSPAKEESNTPLTCFSFTFETGAKAEAWARSEAQLLAPTSDSRAFGGEAVKCRLLSLVEASTPTANCAELIWLPVLRVGLFFVPLWRNHCGRYGAATGLLVWGAKQRCWPQQRHLSRPILGRLIVWGRHQSAIGRWRQQRPRKQQQVVQWMRKWITNSLPGVVWFCVLFGFTFWFLLSCFQAAHLVWFGLFSLSLVKFYWR